MNQGYDFSADYVSNEEQSSNPIQSSGMVGMPPSLNVSSTFDNQTGKILVPSDISNLTQMQATSISPFQTNIISSPMQTVAAPKVDQDGKRRRPKIFQCSYAECGKCFDSQWALTRHIRTHTGEKPFKCPQPNCGKCFAERCALTRHMSSHETTKPFKCPHPGCPKSFKSREYLEAHRKLHEEADIYKCTINNCNRIFSSVKSLRRHQVTWHNSKNTESPTEQILREKILKLQQKHKDRIERMEKHLKELNESNKQLKKENAAYRKEHMIPVGRMTKTKKLLYDREELEQMNSKIDIIPNPTTALSGLTDKSLPNNLFSQNLDVPVGLESLLDPTHVPSNGNLIVLPGISTIEHTGGPLQLDQDINHNENTGIMM